MRPTPARILIALILSVVGVRARADLRFVQGLFDGQGSVQGIRFANAAVVSPDGRYLYVAGDEGLGIFTRDQARGSLTSIGAVTGDSQFYARFLRSLALSPDGTHLYASNDIAGAVVAFRRDPGTGALEFVQALVDGQGAVDALAGAEGVAVSPAGDNVYVAASADNALAVFRVRKPVGSQCDDEGGCESGSCTDGVCCTLRCDAPNDSCTLPGFEGVCVTRCVGDCNGNYQISQTDLLAMVPRALGTADLPGCATGDGNNDGRIAVNEILVAMQNAQTGCRPDVSGVWRQDQGGLESSTCVPALTAVLQETIDTGGTDCDYAIAQQATVVTATETCAGPDGTPSFTGSIDDAGQVKVAVTQSQSVTSACTLSVTDAIAVDGRISQTPATHTLTIRLTGACPFTNCTAVINARWTRLAP